MPDEKPPDTLIPGLTITQQITEAAKQLAVIVGIVASLIGTMKGLEPAQLDPLIAQISNAVVLLGGLGCSVILIWRNLSHREAKAIDATNKASVVANAPSHVQQAVADHLGVVLPSSGTGI